MVVIPAYTADILPLKLSSSTVTAPSLDESPSRYANNVPVADVAVVVSAILTENWVSERFSCTTKSPLNASSLAPANLTFALTFNPWLLTVVTVAIPLSDAWVNALILIASPVVYTNEFAVAVTPIPVVLNPDIVDAEATVILDAYPIGISVIL